MTKKTLPGDAGFGSLLASYKKNAAARGLSWELTEEQFKAFTQSDCHYCGAPPSSVIHGNSKKTKRSAYTYNGLDRVDNKVGYLADNLVPCDAVCNRAKNNMSYDDFVAFLKRVAAFHKDTV